MIIATRNPARLIRARGKGIIAVNNDADFAFLSADAQVVHTMIAGRLAVEA